MIGTVSTDEKAEIAKAHGCAHAIVTSRENIAQRVREITDGKGVPVVYDSVGKDTLMASLDSLQPRGTLVSNGTSSGPVVIDTTLLAVKGSISGHAPGDDPLRHAARAHARHGGGAVRPGARRQDPQRAEPDLRAGRCGRGASRLESRRPPAPPCSCPDWDITIDARLTGHARTSYLFGAARPGSPSHDPRADDHRLCGSPGDRVPVSYMKAEWGLSDTQLGGAGLDRLGHRRARRPADGLFADRAAGSRASS